MTKIAFISTYVPQKCGLAAYTFHLRQAIQDSSKWRDANPVVVLSDSAGEGGGDPMLWPLDRNDEEAYARMADKINQSDVDVVSLQHEFGIFGGEAGAYALTLARRLKKPLVTTFHTVFERPMPPYAPIQKELAELSSRIVVMNRKAVDFLHDTFQIPREKIRFIPHGTPTGNPESRRRLRQRLGWENRKVLMTFGLLSRGKGIELLLKALPSIRREVPEVLYAIVGQTHPGVLRTEGERYREELRELIRRNDLQDHVVMVDRFMEENDLIGHITACDLYVTPYPGMEQITSGTLAYAVGLGRPVLSTPYRYAQDLLADYPELLIPYDDEPAWAKRISEMLRSEVRLKGWSKKIDSLGKPMRWPEVGRRHEQLFAEVSQVETATR
jgi:glycosyltransferase involved in cell wall biosynthesis